eukprot:scaffold256177_cov13-Tisochrysis_lutea.AAC.1
MDSIRRRNHRSWAVQFQVHKGLEIFKTMQKSSDLVHPGSTRALSAVGPGGPQSHPWTGCT